MGLKWQGDNLEFLGDDYGQQGKDGKRFNLNEFSKGVTKSYAKAEVVKQFNLNPELSEFQMVEETVNDKGETVIRFEKWN